MVAHRRGPRRDLSRRPRRSAAPAGATPTYLRKIAADPEAHANAVVFIRVLAETTAAVLVTVAFTLLFDSIWWAMLAAAVLMTGVSYVVVGASPRNVGRLHATRLLRARRARRPRRAHHPRTARARSRRPRHADHSRGVARLVLRVGAAAAQHHRRSRRERAHRGGRSRADPLGVRLHRHVRPRGDGPAHRHGDGGCLGIDPRGDGDLPREGRSRASRSSTTTPTTSSASST